MSSLKDGFDKLKNIVGCPKITFEMPDIRDRLMALLERAEDTEINFFVLKQAFGFGTRIEGVVVDDYLLDNLEAAIDQQAEEPSTTQAIHDQLAELVESGKIMKDQRDQFRKFEGFLDLTKQEAEYMLYNHHHDKLVGVRGALSGLLVSLQKFDLGQIDYDQLQENWGMRSEQMVA